MNAAGSARGPAGPLAEQHPPRAPDRGSEALEALARAFKDAMAGVRRLRGRETHCHAPGSLSYAQYGLLFCLADDSARSARELAEAAALTPATVTQMLEALEAEGLIERVRSERDRRVVLTRLSRSGRTAVAERRARVEPRWRAALEGFSDEQLLTAAAVLERLARYFEEL
jgi:DNA-binding MarR family transcriptional regulator